MKEQFRFHILGLVHLPVSRTYMGCAFTQKVYKLCQMLMSLGHEVYLYGCEGSDAPCTEFVQTHTLRDVRREWGMGDNRPQCNGLGYDWRNLGFRHDLNRARTETTKRYYAACATEITQRKRPSDFLLLPQGVYQKPVADAVRLFLTCESGVGYRGSYAKFRAFESAYIQNFTYGSEHPRESINGNYYDRVIPNYFDLSDFEYSAEKEDYFLFIGRLIKRKGLLTAHKATQAIGARLKIAGQGMRSWNGFKLITEEVTLTGKGLDFVGYVDVEERKELLSKAKAVFVPTVYLEPFGGTNVEAQLSGTPVLTTNFGAFPETVENGKTGFLCNTLDDFVSGAKSVGALDPDYIRNRAVLRYDMECVKWQFQRWFSDLMCLYESTISDAMGWHRIRTIDPEWRGTFGVQ